MERFANSSENALQLEGATVDSVALRGDEARIVLSGADIHHDTYGMSHRATVIVTGVNSIDTIGQPSEIEEASILVSGIGSWRVFLPLPFSVQGTCHVEFVLRSGEQILLDGKSCEVELGPGTRRDYVVESRDVV